MNVQESLQQLGRACLAGVTAFSLTFVLTPAVRWVAVRLGLVAKPAEERWGRRVTARLGGVAMFVGCLGAILLWVPLERSLLWLLGGVSLVFVLGLVDDLHRLFPYTKLIIQLLIGCMMVLGGIKIELVEIAWLSIPLSVLWFVLVMNAFNLLDNMDGLAAGIGAIAAAFCALHAGLAGQETVAMLAVIVGGVCLGFLWYNFPPAKIYMGDSGSHFLGLSLATLALLGSWRRSTQLLSVLVVPVLLLAVPIFDTCFVTIQRLLHGHHPFVGGKDHVSHRLAILGLSAKQTALALYGVSGLLGIVSVLSMNLKLFQTLAVWCSVLAALVVFGRYLARVNVYRVEPVLVLNPTERSTPTMLIETMLLHKRRLMEILVDFFLISSAYVLAYLLRFEGVLSSAHQALLVQSLPVILVVKILCFAGGGLYRGVWRYLGLADIITILKAVTLGSICSSMALVFLWRFEGYSRALLIIDWMLSFLAVGGSRVVERLLDEWIHATAGQHVPVLIIGAGDAGERVLRNLKYGELANRRVVGFLDDDVRKWGSRIHGTPVLGSRAKLPDLLREEQIAEVFIALNDPPGDLLEYIRQCCEPSGVRWKVVTAGITEAV